MSYQIELLDRMGVITAGNKDAEVFDFLLKNVDIDQDYKPSEFVIALWEAYENYPNKSNSLNGGIFESILALVLLKNNISPIFVQAKVVFVPNVFFDFILYSKETGPISISAKTSLRERYKQADLEAISLKYVHRKAKSYLLTLSAGEAATVSNKIKNGDLLGIDKVIVATATEFDDLILNLREHTFIKPEKIEVIESSKILEAI